MIVNILKTLPWFILGSAIFAVPSMLLIGALFAPVDVESSLGTEWVAERFMDLDEFLKMDRIQHLLLQILIICLLGLILTY